MKYLTALLFASIATGANASGLESLEMFVRTVKSGHAEFTQVVTSPAKDGQTPRQKTSSGVFDFSRPSKFKFSYRKPFEQTIVADGKRIWIYDVDLNQVTSRKQSEALAASPASLIATASDIKTLEVDFAFTTAPSAQGLEWVVATPRSKEGVLQSIRIGLKDNNLNALEILDSFGQRSLMTFTAMQVNPAMQANTFQFKPPTGADVIQQ